MDDITLDQAINITRIENEDGSTDIEFLEDEELSSDEVLSDIGHYDNLALYLTEEELQEISTLVMEGYEEDEASREKHISMLTQGIDQLGLDDSNVSTPFEGASTVFHPLIMENAVKIQAKAEGELLPAVGPVKTQILGSPDQEKEKQAYRIKRHMNWQLTEKMPEFYHNTQKAILQAALFGDAFKKNYFDPIKGRVCDTLIPLDRFIVNSDCDTVENAERSTEIQYVSEREMISRQYSGLYRDDIILDDPQPINKGQIGEKIDQLLGLEGMGEGYTVLEQHVYLDLPSFEDYSGVPLPYIVTVEEASGEVLAIRRNWREGQNIFEKREWYTQYFLVPGFGFYNFGYIHLLGNFQMTLTAIMRSLVDAGSFANMQGGFKSKAMRVLDDGEAVSPGEWRDVEFYGNDISKGIYPFNFKEPSGTLFELMQFIEARGQKFADSAEQVVADAANYGPVGTTMALLDASTKFFSTIFKRMHSAQKKQLKIIAYLNYENMPEDPEGLTFNLPGEEINIMRTDYDGRIDIVPVSDPNISSSAHRVTLASQKLQSALQAPELHDLREAYKQYYIAMGDENYEKYLPAAEEPQPAAPMEDIMLATQGKPIKAFPDQDHESHIAVKTTFINDPSVQDNSAFAQAIPALEANIREHTVLRFTEQLQGAQQLGLNAQQAAQEIADFNQYKAENPLGTEDPKQLLARAEMRKQENEQRQLEIDREENMMDAALDWAKLQADIAQQNVKVESDVKTLKLKEAIDMIKSSLKN